MKQHYRARLATIIKNLYPEIFNEAVAISKPKSRDTAVIPDFYNRYLNNSKHRILLIEECPQRHRDAEYFYRMIFVASMLDIFCPASLYGNCFTTDKVCSLLADLFNYNDRQSVSEIISRARAYIKIPSFRDAVIMLSEDFLSTKKAPAICQG